MAYKDAILADQPLGYWPLDDLTGTSVVADASGHGYNGTLVGTNIYGVDGATARLGKAMAFASGGSHVQVPSLDGHLPVGGQPYTIECWVWMYVPPYGTPGTGNGAFVFWGDWTPNGAGPYACNALMNDGSNNLRAVWAGSDPSGWTYTLAQPIDYTLWHHVAVTCDGTTDTLYVDGTQVATQAAYNTHWLGHNFQIGAFLGEDWVLHGSLQHVAVYTSALSRERIAAHYAAAFPYQSAILADEPAAYWPLGESTGLSWTDIGSHGYTLSAPPDPQPGTSGPFASTNAVRFRMGGAVGGAESGLATYPFTMDAWINIAGATDPRGYGAVQAILFWGDDTNIFAPGALDRVSVGIYTEASPYGAGLSMMNSGGGTGVGLDGTAAPSFTTLTGAWHHIAVTMNGSGHFICYVDGVSRATGTLAPSLASPASGVFSIGGAPGADNLGWCDIAYVALYPTVLSGTRIAAHYSATTNSTYRSAVLADAPSAFWPLQET